MLSRRTFLGSAAGLPFAAQASEGAAPPVSREAVISLVCYPPLPADEPDRLARTHARMAEYLADAAARGSDLVAFPELCTTIGSHQVLDFEPLDGPSVSAISQAAREAGVWVVLPIGTLEGDVKRNSCVLIGRDGSVAGVYHKNYPTHWELDAGITPGTETPVFETDFGRVGMCICFDLNYWEVGSGLRREKADLVIWPSMWQGSRMLTRWSIEFGFAMGACWSQRSTIVDIIGREVLSGGQAEANATGGARAPIVTAKLDLGLRLLHHDFNVERLRAALEKYGDAGLFTEWRPEECILLIASRTAGVSTDAMIEEYGFETMRDYQARARRDRRRALEGTYRP